MKMKLGPIAVAAFLGFALVPAVGFCTETVTGTGVHRDNQDACEQSLPEFRARLRALGLTVASKDVECQQVEGEVEAFEPKFKAYSEKPFTAQTALAVHSRSKGDCKDTLESLLAVVADSDEVVVESACVELNVVDREDANVEPGRHYQPMVVLLKAGTAGVPAGSADFAAANLAQ